MWLTHNLSSKQLEDLQSLTREELWQTHFWLSPIIREYLLKENDGLRQRLDHSAFCDDPDLEGQIGMAFLDHLRIVKSDEEKRA
jgi:hypothetical protein